MKRKIIIWGLTFGSILFFGSAFAQTENQTNIPKKIFAKTLAQTLNLKPSEQTKCFKDLNKKGEETPFICSLKKAKIFTGKKTSKFYPDKNANWGFAVKTLCKAQKWTKPLTFKACAAYARKNGFLDSPLPKKLSSKSLISTDELNLLLKRIYGKSEAEILANPPPIAKKSTAAEIWPTEMPKENLPPLSFEPVAESSISTTFFNNIVLSAPLLNTFYLNEVYFVEGDLINTSADEVLVFLCRKSQECDNSVNFINKTNGNHFKIPLYFKETGNFSLGIIPGRSGQSIISPISVLPGPPPESIGGSAPLELSAIYSSGETTFKWNSGGSLARLIIFQENQRRDYIFRQTVKSFSPSSTDFAEFKKGPAGWLIKQNSVQSEIQKINLTVKDFIKIETDKIQIKNFPEIFQNPEHFTFEGKTLSLISNKAAFTLPNGQVKEIIFAENNLPSNTDFKIEMDLDAYGTYIFEINDPGGGAVVNAPIYVGQDIPLLPDFFALNPAKLDQTALNDLNQARQKLLELINLDRAKYSLSPISLSNELNQIAQGHSDNMIKLNFFGHIDPFGKGPEDRRKAAKFPAAVKENLAKSATLELAQAGLMRSPIHRIAILDPSVAQVGFGIAKNTEGYLFVTQNFAEPILTKTDLLSLETELFNKLNDERIINSLPLLTANSALNVVAEKWAQRMADEDFFDDTAPNGDSIAAEVRNQNIKSTLQMHIVNTNEKNQLTEEVLKQPGVADANNKSVGIGLGLNYIGELFMTVIYAQ
ncbi:hypothetical protein HZC21_04720 [Candidatus Peregrinibacteria bacterium]|nr:hypothetical protein [Candidatus Peregrinibacteria bacterium]